MNLLGYTLTLFFPTIINGLGYSVALAQLLSIPPYASAFIMTMSIAVLAERKKRRAPFIIGGSAVGLFGYVMLLTGSWSGLSCAGTIVATAGIFPATVRSWPANNVSSQKVR